VPEPLNELERRVLDYIVEYLRTNTYQPSIREIGREFAIKSTKTVSELLQSLANKGWIERDPSRSRGVRVIGLESHPGTVSVPVVQADMLPGGEYFEIDRRFVGAPGSFLMPMPGAHLAEHGIHAGDLLLVEPMVPADLEDGDIVIARIAGRTAVRRLAGVDSGLVLEAEVPGETAVTLTAEQAAAVLQGRVSGVVRRLRPAAPHVSASAAAVQH
jgi:repressor LexA